MVPPDVLPRAVRPTAQPVIPALPVDSRYRSIRGANEPEYRTASRQQPCKHALLVAAIVPVSHLGSCDNRISPPMATHGREAAGWR